jgi:hypothetical protein
MKFYNVGYTNMITSKLVVIWRYLHKLYIDSKI